jgi:hypothetical protein
MPYPASMSRFFIAVVLTVFMLASFAGTRMLAEDGPDEGPALIVTGDFNKDDIADYAKVVLPGEGRSGPAQLVILLGQAHGAFSEAASGVALGPAPRSIVAGDFNRDGNPDVIVGDNDGTLLLFLGDGTGRMLPAGAIAHLDSTASIAVADFNRDGNLDVAVSDWRASRVMVLLGNGKGGFRHAWSFPLRMRGKSPHLAAADFNGDGTPDLAVVYDDDDGDTFDVMLSNGNGTFTAAPDLGFIKDPNAHCVT